MTNGIEAALAALATDRALQGSVGTDAALVVWSATLDRVLWASRAADGFVASIADPEGRPRLLPELRERLRELSGGLAPRTGMRLARLRFAPEPAPPSTVACRLITVDDADALLTIFMTAMPQPVPAEPAASGTPAAPAGDQPAGILRFTWSMDRHARFRSVSPSLGELVGRAGADVVGRSWLDLLGRVVFDPAGTIAGHIAARATWSDERIYWRVGAGDRVVPVDLGGMPVFGRAHEFDGFRGFGFCLAGEMTILAEIRKPAIRDATPPRLAAAERGPDRSAEAAILESQPTRVATVAGAGRSGPGRAAVSAEPGEPRPSLSLSERGALREIARALGGGPDGMDVRPPDPVAADGPDGEGPAPDAARILDRLPVGILILRGEAAVYANRAFLDLVGFGDLPALAAAGGAAALFADRAGAPGPGTRAATLVGRGGAARPADIRLTGIEWDGAPASLMLVRSLAEAPDGEINAPSLRVELADRERRIREDEAILDLAGVAAATLDGAGRILSLTGPAETLFGYAANEVVGDSWTLLLAPESHPAAIGRLSSLTGTGAEADLRARRRDGSGFPARIRLRRLDRDGEVVLTVADLSELREREAERASLRLEAEEAGKRQSDILARVSHEIRTPLNAILGFAEIMLEERFGPVGNERYASYLKDIHGSGGHVLSLVNDLLDLAQIASGRAELAFTSLDLNEVAAASVALMGPSAVRGKIVIRSRFARNLPAVIADERSVKQIALNLVSNAIRYTEAGGQVIVSTGLTDAGDVVLRVRDTGIGMSADEIEAALEPFRQIAVDRRAGGTGLGLPLAKALTDANRGRFTITSAPREGTLVEILFPRSRVLED